MWRGHRSRRRTFQIWREIWDQQEEKENGAYPTAEASLRQLRRLLLFYNPRRQAKDVDRLVWYGTRQSTTETEVAPDSPWPAAYARLQSACLKALRIPRDQDSSRAVLYVLAYAAQRVRFTTETAAEYYEVLTSSADKSFPLEPLQAALLAPLKKSHEAYAGLTILLSKPHDLEMLGLLRSAIDPKVLAQTVAGSSLASYDVKSRLWLLGNILYVADGATSVPLTTVVAELLGSLADSVDFEAYAAKVDNIVFDRDITGLSTGLPLNAFLREQIGSLVNQESIRHLINNETATSGSNYAQTLAGYALTLLRCFPRKADEIRMWLYRGPANSDGLPVAQYIWNACISTNLYGDILSSARNVLSLLKRPDAASQLKGDWTVILMFMELYTFTLKIMDDEEFMGSTAGRKQRNPVAIGEVASLVTFLKNLGFTLYFHAAELNEAPSMASTQVWNSPASARASTGSTRNIPPALVTKSLDVAGLPGLTFDYIKGLVTGLLRAIYERDSRRHFLPKDHWLMTDRFDMQSFIPGVVAEEESRHRVQEQEEEDRDDSDDEDDPIVSSPTQARGYVMSSHARALRTQHARERAQRKASRKRYLESVAPRLEILQNMPFFIPFYTRVQIFRQFVFQDQERRRNGFVDPDLWRQSVMMQMPNGVPPHELLARHHATIKRQQEFSDAYTAFYDLGPALKEPIQITFVDSFGMPEAGIDGGGVTKEFLTSVITQAFDQSSDTPEKYFVENEKHLLFPNPVAMEETRMRARLHGLQASRYEKIDVAAVERDMRVELLRRYDFLGRIIGKCLYEGILVDVTFAGFFLKKWALTGGSGSASSETGYRASINDLRELDEDLYRGLLALKTAEDAEAFGAVFAVNNSIEVMGRQEVIQVDLVENGAEISVTNENRLSYISYLSRYKLQTQSSRQTNAFLKGLSMMIQPSWLSMFNQTELQTLIGGASAEIDVQDLRRNTQYGGTYVIGDDGREHSSVEMFWDVMQKMEDQDRRKVLKFVTSTPRGPLLGFSYLNPKFSIRDSGSDENRFPTTSTCVNLLKLPMYRSERMLREKLLAAINSGAGFDLS